jgi:hypothetical protein
VGSGNQLRGANQETIKKKKSTGKKHGKVEIFFGLWALVVIASGVIRLLF